MFSRQTFVINYDTGDGVGARGDTGPHFSGAILQMRWNPTDGDTGGDLTLMLLPKDGDTGDGWIFFDDNDCLGTNFTRVPTQPQHHSDGTDTGASSDVPIVSAGDRIRVKVTPGRDACAGRLYIWTAD